MHWGKKKTLKAKIVRKPEWGGNCGVCGSEVLLLNDGEPWKLSCACQTVDVPQWCIVDPWQRRQYRRRFDLVFFEVPSVTEGGQTSKP